MPPMTSNTLVRSSPSWAPYAARKGPNRSDALVLLATAMNAAGSIRSGCTNGATLEPALASTLEATGDVDAVWAVEAAAGSTAQSRITTWIPRIMRAGDGDADALAELLLALVLAPLFAAFNCSVLACGCNNVLEGCDCWTSKGPGNKRRAPLDAVALKPSSFTGSRTITPVTSPVCRTMIPLILRSGSDTLMAFAMDDRRALPTEGGSSTAATLASLDISRTESSA